MTEPELSQEWLDGDRAVYDRYGKLCDVLDGWLRYCGQPWAISEKLETPGWIRAELDTLRAALKVAEQRAKDAEASNATLTKAWYAARRERDRYKAEREEVAEHLREYEAALARERGGGSPLTRKQYLSLRREGRATLSRIEEQP